MCRRWYASRSSRRASPDVILQIVFDRGQPGGAQFAPQGGRSQQRAYPREGGPSPHAAPLRQKQGLTEQETGIGPISSPPLRTSPCPPRAPPSTWPGAPSTAPAPPPPPPAAPPPRPRRRRRPRQRAARTGGGARRGRRPSRGALGRTSRPTPRGGPLREAGRRARRGEPQWGSEKV